MLAEVLRDLVNQTIEVRHPVLEGVHGVSHVQFIGPARPT
jgi:proline racemase